MLIGCISLVPFGLFVRIAYQVVSDGEASINRVSWICASLFAMPGFWFAGDWLGSTMMTGLDWENLIEPYINALALTFVPVGGILDWLFD